MSIPVPKPTKVVREDLGPDAPDWTEPLLSAFNGFVEDVRASLTAAANETGQHTATLETSATVADSFPLKIKTAFPPKSLWLGQVLNLNGQPTWTDPVAITSWFIDTKGLVNIRFITGLPASTKLRIVFEYR